MTANLTRGQKEALAWALQCAIVDGLGGDGDTLFGDLDSTEVHPTLGITWTQAMRQILVWLSRLPGGCHPEFVKAAHEKAGA